MRKGISLLEMGLPKRKPQFKRRFAPSTGRLSPVGRGEGSDTEAASVMLVSKLCKAYFAVGD